MAIAQLTQLRIAIPLSGNVPGEVSIDCFPMTDDLDKTKVTKRVSFATGGQISMVPVESIPTGNRDCGTVPRWRLAREGPFPNERSQASLRVLGKGCAFRHTTYSVEDHARPEGGLGVPLNHPRFLEWLGAPDSAWSLEMSPGHWCDTLSRDQAMMAAMQLHRDACLMQTNLNILDQYALALHGTASKLLQKTIGGSPYPRAEVTAAAPGTHARRASVQMEALGLWRPSMDPLQFATARS